MPVFVVLGVLIAVCDLRYREVPVEAAIAGAALLVGYRIAIHAPIAEFVYIGAVVIGASLLYIAANLAWDGGFGGGDVVALWLIAAALAQYGVPLLVVTLSLAGVFCVMFSLLTRERQALPYATALMIGAIASSFVLPTVL